MARKKKDDAPESVASDAPPLPPSAAPEPVRSLYDLAGSPDRGIAVMAEMAEKQGRAFGRNNMLPLSDAPYARIRKMPIGIFWFDLRTAGGIVINRINRIWGPPSTLKSTMCLRAIRSAQRSCRYCHYPLVPLLDGSRLQCRCPSTRFWLLDDDDYAWLSTAQGLKLGAGELPDGAEVKKVKGQEGRICAVLRCPPPPSRPSEKAREIVLAETYRCEPKRTLFLDGERTTDELWVTANGVDARLVNTLGAKWGEQSLDTITDAVQLEKELEEKVTGKTREKRVDFIVIDSTSILETAANLEKGLGERPVVASKAQMLGRWVSNFLATMAEEGLTSRFTPTVLATSQVSTHGIGPKQHAHLAPTDGWKFQHALALDVQMNEAGYEFNKSNTRARWGNFDFTIRKNKSGGSVKVGGTIKFWVTAEDGHPVGDSDDVATVMDVARKLGARDPDNWISVGTGKAALILHTPYAEGGKVPFMRVGDCEKFLADHPGVYDDLRTKVLETLIADAALEDAVLAKPKDKKDTAAEMADV